MQKFQIFISSTYEDLRRERELVTKSILEMGHIPVGMEMFSAADEEQWRLISRHIEESDYYVVIVAHRYGSTVGGLSFTEKEYDFAVSQKIPTLGFVIDDSAPWPGEHVERSAAEQLDRFKKKVKSKPVAFWSSAEDLYGRVAIALSKQFTSTPRPGWTRATTPAAPNMSSELTRLREENRTLREQVSQKVGKAGVVKKNGPGEKHLAILRVLAEINPQSILKDGLAEKLNWPYIHVSYYVDQLISFELAGSHSGRIYLTTSGRNYVVENGILPG
jgi:hypothetical protein